MCSYLLVHGSVCFSLTPFCGKQTAADWCVPACTAACQRRVPPSVCPLACQANWMEISFLMTYSGVGSLPQHWGVFWLTGLQSTQTEARGNVQEDAETKSHIVHIEFIMRIIWLRAPVLGQKCAFLPGLPVLIKRNGFLPTAGWMAAKLSCCLIYTTWAGR